ncbi:MAG: Asp-tRNA(Asn)/Glu-tRNA(Gln) amidotransferase subunit GatC [Bacteroidia bacterium]|nr:Asp-tRNA(Asn)/Glu-tRNA(Gln) amidotransferase subunit GatC [Bacteroidia bacterium]
MQITDELLDRIEALSMLSFKPEEREKTKEGFQRMLDFVAKLQELDTTGVEPLIHMTDEVNRLIPDEATEPLPQKLVLKNAPASDDAHFHVPKVLKK